jgi:hypothetical protein
METAYPKRIWQFVFGKPITVEFAEACEGVKGLRKAGYNDELDFDFLKILDLANQLRAELLPRGLLLVPNDVEYLEEPCTADDGLPGIQVRVKTEFEVTNGRRRLSAGSAYGVGRDAHGFALAIAQTMALKSWLKRISLLFGEEDDIERSHGHGQGQGQGQRPAPYCREAQGVRSYQERALSAALRTCGLTREGAEALLSKVMGFPITCEGIADLPREDFDVAMVALANHEDLAAQLELSVRAAEAAKRKPQPVVTAIDEPWKDEITG